ncbi:hisB [Mytilus edulis]|uniref:HisB n=1 Tax=Mytilus edulis TaxID=6550 RepID=A0A8S3U5M5_MYTED|nr:hisB [Mytilus edulis]
MQSSIADIDTDAHHTPENETAILLGHQVSQLAESQVGHSSSQLKLIQSPQTPILVIIQYEGLLLWQNSTMWLQNGTLFDFRVVPCFVAVFYVVFVPLLPCYASSLLGTVDSSVLWEVTLVADIDGYIRAVFTTGAVQNTLANNSYGGIVYSYSTQSLRVWYPPVQDHGINYLVYLDKLFGKSSTATLAELEITTIVPYAKEDMTDTLCQFGKIIE